MDQTKSSSVCAEMDVDEVKVIVWRDITCENYVCVSQ